MEIDSGVLADGDGWGGGRGFLADFFDMVSIVAHWLCHATNRLATWGLAESGVRMF